MYNIKIHNKLTSITTWKVLGLSLATRGISWKGEIGPQSSSRNTLKIINEKGGWEEKYHKMYNNIFANSFFYSPIKKGENRRERSNNFGVNLVVL